MAEFFFNTHQPPRKIKGDKSGKNTQKEIVRYVGHIEGHLHHKIELHILAQEKEGYRCGRNSRYQQRDDGGQRQVEHKHLQRKHQPGDGSFKNAGNTTSRATGHQ